MAAILRMATNSIKDNDILMIIKTMVYALIDTLRLTAIHLRVNLIKYISDKKLCNLKWPPFLASIGKKAITAFWLIFIYSTNFEINTNNLHQVFLLQNELLINNYIISQQARHVETVML